ncbi:flagellar hook-length control protein FliK [Chromobacterium sphagni]|nr:flagellar hook-length control protein FliK [Chromobacterium sphagni]
MSRVAPPQTSNALPGMADDAIGQALDIDDPSQPARVPAQDFASALQALQPPVSVPPASEAAPPQLHAAQLIAPPPLAAQDDGIKPDEGKKDEARLAQADLAVLSPALQPPLIWQSLPLTPRQALPVEALQPQADPAPRAAAASLSPADAKPLAALAADLPTPRADAQQAGLLAALPLPAIHQADGGKPAEAFSLQLPAAQSDSWSGKLQAALGERLQLLSSQNQERATIRLDPPALGTLEIAIRHQAGALTVELTASHSEVVKQLQTIGDSLRQDLGGRQYTQVAVEVKEGMPSGHGQGGKQNREQQQQNPGRALREQGWQTAEAFQLDQG